MVRDRSFRLNFEVTALLMNRDFARDVEAMFERDFARSRRMTMGEITDRSLWQRVAARGAYLFAPVL